VPEPSYLVASVLVAAAVTWSLRAIPFAILAPLRRSELVHYLGSDMPVGVMAVLVVFSLRDTSFTAAPYGASTLVALGVTVGLHLWRGNVAMSLLAGTLAHVALASTVFAG
jgi:branched-subunit amino acid transport protein AzlD